MEARLLFNAVRRFYWLILLCALIGGALGAGLGLMSKVQYKASASVSVAEPDFALLTGSQSQLDPAQYVVSQVGIIESDTTLSSVAAQAHLPRRTVEQAVSVGQRPASDIIDIEVTSPSAAGAAKLANLVAATYIADETSYVNGLLSSTEASLQTRLDPLPQAISAARTAAEAGALSTEYANMSQQLSQIEVTSKLALANTQVVDTAVVPVAPQPRHIALKGAIGFGGGALVGLVLAVVLAATRPRMLRGRDVEDAIGVATAAELPHVSEWTANVTDGSPSRRWREAPDFAEEMTKVAVFVEAARSSRNCKTVLVTSLERGAGVSTVASALASMLGDGSRVVKLLPRPGLPTPSENDDQVESVGTNEDISATSWGGFSVPPRVAQSWGEHVATRPRIRSHRTDPPLETRNYDADVLVVDGGSLSESASSVALAQTLDVTVLVVPLPNDNERYLNAVVRATFSDAKGQLLMVTNNVSGQKPRLLAGRE